MNKKLKFSIVVPTYNRAHLITKTILSLKNQNYSNYEIIIVDDGSTDETEKVLQQYISNSIKYYKIRNSERGFARNYGARLAQGEYINFFDSDDIALSNHLEEASAAIKNLSSPEIFHLNYAFVNSNLEVVRMSNNMSKHANERLVSGNILSCNGVFLRKDVALEYPFNESRDLSVSEDWQLWLRLSSRFIIHLVPEVTSYIVNHEERSVNQFNELKIKKRRDALVNSLESDPVFKNKYPNGSKRIRAHMDSYLALHSAINGYKLKPLKYLIKAVKNDVRTIFSRRTLAIAKHFFITY